MVGLPDQDSDCPDVGFWCNFYSPGRFQGNIFTQPTATASTFYFNNKFTTSFMLREII